MLGEIQWTVRFCRNWFDWLTSKLLRSVITSANHLKTGIWRFKRRLNNWTHWKTRRQKPRDKRKEPRSFSLKSKRQRKHETIIYELRWRVTSIQEYTTHGERTSISTGEYTIRRPSRACFHGLRNRKRNSALDESVLLYFDLNGVTYENNWRQNH